MRLCGKRGYAVLAGAFAAMTIMYHTNSASGAAAARANADSQPGKAVMWEQLPTIPDPIGFAGMYAGVSNGALIAAGGANFPTPLDEGGAKVWYDTIYVLESPDGEWKKLDATLPQPMAYGISANWQDGVIFAGGGNGERHFAETYFVRWDGEQLSIEQLPSLPKPCHYTAGVIHEGVLYAAAGQAAPDSRESMHDFWAMDLKKPRSEMQWEVLPAWPGRPRAQMMMAAAGKAVYLMSGISIRETDGNLNYDKLADCYRFDVEKGAWSEIAEMPEPRGAAPTPLMVLDNRYILIMGGVTGAEKVPESGPHAGVFPGFAEDILSYDTQEDAWSTRGRFPKDMGPDPQDDPNAGLWPVVTAPATYWNGHYVVVNGEVRGGVRTPKVVRATPVNGKFTP